VSTLEVPGAVKKNQVDGVCNDTGSDSELWFVFCSSISFRCNSAMAPELVLSQDDHESVGSSDQQEQVRPSHYTMEDRHKSGSRKVAQGTGASSFRTLLRE
jgi:hypothetical protein